MNRKLPTVGLSAAIALAIAAAPASATVIGAPSQSNGQAVNGTQLNNAATATGTTFVIDPPATSPPGASQHFGSSIQNAQTVGNSVGPSTLISPTGVGPSQLNHQGENVLQGSNNGAVILQDIGSGVPNELISTQIIGGGPGCAAPLAACAASLILGSPTQAGQQGVNTHQAADGGVTTGDSITAPTIIVNGLPSPTSQVTANALTNTQLVIG